MKENNLQPRLLYPARISFKYEGEIKSFTDRQKLREFSTTKPGLQQMLKDILYFCFIDYAEAFDCVDHNKLENSSTDGNTRPSDLPLEKFVCRSGRNG